MKEKRNIGKSAKKRIETFGVRKFSIIIIGLIIGLVGLLYVFLHNAQGGLIEINYKEYQDYFKKGTDLKLIYIAGDDDNSTRFLPILKEQLQENGIQAYYLNMVPVIKNGKEAEFMMLNPVTSESYMIPMLLVMKDKKVIDSLQGYSDAKAINTLIKKNKLK